MKALFFKLMRGLVNWIDPKLEKWREPKPIKKPAPVKPWTPNSKLELAEMLKRTPKEVMSARERQAFSAAMSFNELRAKDLMIPKTEIRMVKTTEILGPILLDELYRSGFRYFPVMDENRKVVGWVNTETLSSLKLKESLQAEKLMKSEINYIRDDYSLPQVIAAFNRTLAPFLLVIDKYQRLIGIIVMEAIIEFLTFQECRDEFNADDDMALVAKRQ